MNWGIIVRTETVIILWFILHKPNFQENNATIIISLSSKTKVWCTTIFKNELEIIIWYHLCILTTSLGSGVNSFLYSFLFNAMNIYGVPTILWVLYLTLEIRLYMNRKRWPSNKIIPAQIITDCPKVPIGIRRRSESGRRLFGGLDLELGFYESKHELEKTNPSTNTKS